MFVPVLVLVACFSSAVSAAAVVISAVSVNLFVVDSSILGRCGRRNTVVGVEECRACFGGRDRVCACYCCCRRRCLC